MTSKLHEDVRLGKVAQHAFDTYLRSKFEQLEADLFRTFLSSPPGEGILELKRLSMVLGTLKERVQADIDNGMLAEKQLIDKTQH